MRTLKVHLKVITLFFSVLILFQGCVTVYKSTNVTLEEAVRADTKVRITTNDNQTMKYLNITKINQEYFGIKKVHGGLTKIPIQKEAVEIVRIKNKPMSTIVGALIYLGGFIVVVVTGVVLSGGFAIM
ncbi:hypothetical protein V8G56_07530 [Gaetbulibacter aquiaggeris]|uniref:Lipoprotein n=1 Tax=Gaetbulibacter aquiaggeris TaxID=1735373 RepID=A0ABW7MP32_9FLAO